MIRDACDAFALTSFYNRWIFSPRVLLCVIPFALNLLPFSPSDIIPGWIAFFGTLIQSTLILWCIEI